MMDSSSGGVGAVVRCPSSSFFFLVTFWPTTLSPRVLPACSMEERYRRTAASIVQASLAPARHSQDLAQRALIVRERTNACTKAFVFASSAHAAAAAAVVTAAAKLRADHETVDLTMVDAAEAGAEEEASVDASLRPATSEKAPTTQVTTQANNVLNTAGQHTLSCTEADVGRWLQTHLVARPHFLFLSLCVFSVLQSFCLLHTNFDVREYHM